MVRIEIAVSLVEEIQKTFDRHEANTVLDLIESVKDNPQKGKRIGSFGSLLIKELKYKKYRFYFLTDGKDLRFLSEKDMVDRLLRFVRMSDKKTQQKTIDEIRRILRTIGPDGF